jgi:hypothetical protein
MTRKRRGGILDDRKIVETIIRLHSRIAERFPDSGLASVCATVADVSRVTAARAAKLGRPWWGLRLLVAAVIAFGIGLQLYFAELVDWSAITEAKPMEAAEGIDAIVNLLIFVFGGIWFVITLEIRWKRRRVLAHLYEFRSLAHIVDMHQLTKDPTIVLSSAPPTASSPERRMSEFELSRYLDYCAEMLALIAKLAALYAERTQDREVTNGVNEIEELTNNLGRKIWQKIMIVSRLNERQAGPPAVTAPAAPPSV